MRKIIRKYKLYDPDDIDKMEKNNLEGWLSLSYSTKTEVAYSLWEDYCEMHGVDVNAQRLQRVFKIGKNCKK
jgi:L-rhamnose isomerase